MTVPTVPSRSAVRRPGLVPLVAGRVISYGIDLVYLVLLLLVSPWLLYLILWKKRGVGSLAERLGAAPRRPGGPSRFWFHAVSVGEFEAALPLIHALGDLAPQAEIVISTTTTTAQRLARDRCPDHPVFLFPIDLGPCVRRTLRRLQPTVLVLMELELWPNLILNCRLAGIPVTIANGRVSTRGFARMQKVRFLLRPFFRRIDRILVQNDEYSDRLRQLGVAPEKIGVAGNLKFDRPPVDDPAGSRQEFEARWQYGGGLRWIAGCTHPGEEQIALDVHRRLREHYPDLSLILAPRHVERAGEVLELARAQGFMASLYEERSGPASEPTTSPDVIVVNVIGVLLPLYASSDVAFVGGSLVPRGGHNLLEPILAGTPALHGPYTSNFREIVDLLRSGEVSREVENGDGLYQEARNWLQDAPLRQGLADRGRDLLARHRGVAQRSVNEILALADNSE